MAKYEKKRSARRSTPRHPITMASTAEPPDPMPCALAVILLPVSRARGCRMQRGLFQGAYCACRDVRVRAAHACGVRGCGVDARREHGHQHGCGEAVPGDAGGRRALVGSPVPAPMLVSRLPPRIHAASAHPARMNSPNTHVPARTQHDPGKYSVFSNC